MGSHLRLSLQCGWDEGTQCLGQVGELCKRQQIDKVYMTGELLENAEAGQNEAQGAL